MPKALSILLLLTLLLAGNLSGQEKGKVSKRQPARSLLNDAYGFREKDPQKSIALLSELLTQQQSDADLVAIYTLLGDIYTDIAQYDLASARYNSALKNKGRTTSTEQEAGLYRRLGTANARLNKHVVARTAFDICLRLSSPKSSEQVLCREGLADLEAELENLELSQGYYSDVQNSRLNDSLLQVRVRSKRADVYLKQGDLESSANTIREAADQIPAKGKLAKSDEKKFLATNARIRKEVLEAAPEMDESFSLEVSTRSPELIASDNFTRFKALLTSGDALQAEEFLQTALAVLDNDSPVDLSSEIYAAAADYYLDRNQPTEAAAAYRKYTASNERLIREKREELDRQVAILRAQQGIDLTLKDQDAAAAESAYRSDRMALQQYLIYLLVALLAGALLSVVLILRNVRKRRRANQELLLRNLQTRMNPHFIFNSLNSINNYIARQDERSANRFLGRFAKLMRKVLDQSGRDFVPLSEELEQLSLYLELEQERFAGKFSYDIVVEEGAELDLEQIVIPPMIVQPYLENAIWHGLRYREAGGELHVKVVTENTSRVTIEITDNGIGRERSLELKTKNQLDSDLRKSQGMEITQKRIELINEYFGRQLSVAISDAHPNKSLVGTRVLLTIA